MARSVVVGLSMVDSGSGDPISIDQLFLGDEEGPPFNHGHGWARVAGRVRLRVPSGRLRLRTSDRKYAALDTTIAASPGRNDVTLRFVGARGIHLVPMREGKTLAWDPGIRVTVSRIAADGTVTVVDGDGDDRIEVSLPGRYRIEFEDDDGEEQLPPVEVTVPEGDVVEVPVEAKRSR